MDDPFLPEVGEMFWTKTEIFPLPDPKPKRPVVVIERPSGSTGRIYVVTRTTDTKKAGVPHGPVPELGLIYPGVFWRGTSTEARMWTPANCKKIGELDAATLRLVMERYG